MFWASFKGHDAVVRLILKNGATIDSADNQGFTPLFAACLKGHESTARLLLEKGATIDLANNNGTTPLNIA